MIDANTVYLCMTSMDHIENSLIIHHEIREGEIRYLMHVLALDHRNQIAVASYTHQYGRIHAKDSHGLQTTTQQSLCMISHHTSQYKYATIFP